MMMYRRSVTPLAFGLVEPLMYLLTIGFGVGSLVGTVPGVDVRYPVFVAPAILATTAMNTAFNQTSFGVFSRIKVDLTYEAIVPTPLSAADIAVGEVASAVLNGLLTSIGFLAAAAALGLVISPGILLAIPAAALVGFAFAAGGLAVTTFTARLPRLPAGPARDAAHVPVRHHLLPAVGLPGLAAAADRGAAALPEHRADPRAGARPLRLARRSLSAACYLAVFGAVAMIIATRRLGKLLAA